ncbi:DUF2971 domain-containing protein [Natrinema gelatinilyticum]|uniref:DUF2971 domain-containing protein n=1 Tax=Natrinema gelatinilyticum TaxID=2961571 RepID=UPI0020C4273D|nr:DUF2971 domain-containing protein [Natrinema gelatinilyticum]
MPKDPEGEIIPRTKIVVNGDEEQGTLSLNWKPESVSDDTEIWRYRSLKRYISILDEEYLWFSRPDQFEDPFEGSIPGENIRNRNKLYDSEINRARSTARHKYRYTTYLNCWYSEEHESDAMWRLYSNSGDGVAIKSTHGQLKHALEPIHSKNNPKKSTVKKATMGEVKYKDYNNSEIPVDSILAPLFHKRKAFEFEKEYRILVQFLPDELISGSGRSVGEQFNFKDLSPVGIPIPVDASELIEEVVVSPTASDSFVEIIESVTKIYGYDFDVVSSKLHKDPFF